jgi:hypothetical protein
MCTAVVITMRRRRRRRRALMISESLLARCDSTLAGGLSSAAA